MKELLKRTISGVIFVLIIIFLLGIDDLGMLVLLTTINIFSLLEFYNLSYKIKLLPYKVAGVVAGTIMVMISYLAGAGLLPQKFFILIIIILSLTAIPPLFYQPSVFFNSWISTLTGLIYISLPLSLVPFIGFINKQYEFRIILSIFILIWVYDSLAYLTGKTFGKHRILPSVSPKKTWEGAMGGMIFTLVAAVPLQKFFNVLSIIEWIILAAIITLSSTLGDFLESAIKRNAGVKNSGRFMPGHGGFLDRFDSFLFTVPFVFIYLYIII